MQLKEVKLMAETKGIEPIKYPDPADKPEWYDVSTTSYLGYDLNTPIPDYLRDADLETLQSYFKGLKTQMSEFRETLEDNKKAAEATKNQIETLDAQYLAIRNELGKAKAIADRVSLGAKPFLNAIDRRTEAIDKLIQQKENAAAAQREWDRIQEEWANLENEMPWRDEALEHQKKGAQRLVVNRKTILGDVMGLGKTLTAIATCDYIKAKTAESDYHMKPNISGYDEEEWVHDPPAGRKILYLCPAELATNVQREFKKWAAHRGFPLLIAGTTRNARRSLMTAIKYMTTDYVVLLNYEAWRKDKQLINELIACEFDTVILDECHYLKERKSINYRGVAHLLKGKDFTNEGGQGYVGTLGANLSDKSPYLYKDDGSIYRTPRFVFPMSGTPYLNKPQEFYSALSLVDPYTYPDNPNGEKQFLNTYCYKDEMSKWHFSRGGLDSLAKRITNLYLRRTLKDAGVKLPPQDIQYHELEIDEEAYPAQAKARKEMRERALLMIKNNVVSKANAMIAVYTRLRQIETFPHGIKVPVYDDEGNVVDHYQFQVDESQKLDYVIRENGDGYVGLIPEVCPEQRTVLFSQFTTEVFDELQRRCEAAGLRTVVLSGKTPKSLKERVKDDIDRSVVSKRAEEKGRVQITSDDYEFDVALCNYKVGGQGLNFTHFTQTIILDEQWNPGMRDQAYGRTDRMGQTEENTVHVVRMLHTIDEWMAGIMAMKEQDVDNLNIATEFIKGMEAGEI